MIGTRFALFQSMFFKIIILTLQFLFITSLGMAKENKTNYVNTVIAYPSFLDISKDEAQERANRLPENIENYQYSSNAITVKIDHLFYRRALKDLGGDIVYEIRRNNSECFAENSIDDLNSIKKCTMRFECNVIKKNGEDLLMCPTAMNEGKDSFTLVKSETDEFFIQVSITRPKPMRDYEKTIVDRSPILSTYLTR